MGEATGHDRHRVSQTFTTAELALVRDLVRKVAVDAGFTAARTDDLVLVVNELAVNAILHAGGSGSLTVEVVPGGVAVEVVDEGPGLPAEFTTELPGPEVTGGRGLWLVRRLSQQVTFTTAARGTSVRLVMPRA